MLTLQHGAFGRDGLLDNLKLLVSMHPDIEYKSQREIVDIIISFFFDDTKLAQNPEGLIGVMLYNMEEVQILKKLLERFSVLMSTFDLDNKIPYLSSPEWTNVLTTANEALKEFMKNDAHPVE
ncbi:MAG: hypothetical protein ABI947_12610 [Chloroflexota bacterium]